MRVARKPRFNVLDVAFIRALETAIMPAPWFAELRPDSRGLIERIVAEKQALRDVTDDPRIDRPERRMSCKPCGRRF
jgi:hypothetical protein